MAVAVIKSIDTENKLETLAGGARFDICGYNPGENRFISDRSPLRFIHRAALPEGGSVCLFKVLLTNVCVNDCAYCANQAGRDVRRFSFKPEELARTFMELHQRRLAQGLFLTSGIAGDPSRTQQLMINTVEILRRHYEFHGYIHLKILPGASLDCVEEACKLTNRVSVNMEAPTQKHLARLSSKKDIHRGIIERMRWVKQIIDNHQRQVPAGQTTQFVVGAAGETDRELVSASNALYREMDLRRVYFSAFQPVSHSSLEEHIPTPPMREHRLYQVDWLLRIYGFSLKEVELALGQNDDLPLNRDPKLTIARQQPWLFPVDVNAAGYDELLRVPGIGPVSARRIIDARKEHSIFSVEQLKKMRVVTGRAVPFIWFQGMTALEKQSSFLPQLEGDTSRQKHCLATLVG